MLLTCVADVLKPASKMYTVKGNTWWASSDTLTLLLTLQYSLKPAKQWGMRSNNGKSKKASQMTEHEWLSLTVLMSKVPSR